MIRLSRLLVCVVLGAAACTTQGTEETPTDQSPARTAQSIGPSAAARADPTEGWLAVDLRSRTSGYDEGAVAFVEVRDTAGALVARAHRPNMRVYFLQQMLPGTYDVRTFLRPCDGSCEVLDGITEPCRSSVEMAADGSNGW